MRKLSLLAVLLLFPNVTNARDYDQEARQATAFIKSSRNYEEEARLATQEALKSTKLYETHYMTAATKAVNEKKNLCLWINCKDSDIVKNYPNYIHCYLDSWEGSTDSKVICATSDGNDWLNQIGVCNPNNISECFSKSLKPKISQPSVNISQSPVNITQVPSFVQPNFAPRSYAQPSFAPMRSFGGGSCGPSG